MHAIRRTLPVAIAASLALVAVLVHVLLSTQHAASMAQRAGQALDLSGASFAAVMCGPASDSGGAPATAPTDCPICLAATAASFTPPAPASFAAPADCAATSVAWSLTASAPHGVRLDEPRSRGPPPRV